MEEDGRGKLAILYVDTVEDRRRYQELIDYIDMVLARMRKELCIEV